MKCPCGKELGEWSPSRNYCPYCGRKIEWPQAEEEKPIEARTGRIVCKAKRLVRTITEIYEGSVCSV